MSCGIDYTVGKLIDLVIKNHDSDWIGRLLEREGYLSYYTLRAMSKDPSESWLPELEDAVFRLYAQASPYGATRRIAHSDGMAAVVNQLAEEAGDLEQVDPSESLDGLIKKALQRLGLPLYQKPVRSLGLSSTLANLHDVQKGLLSLKKGQAKDLYALQGFTMTSWASIEQLLEMTIRFYVRHFSTVSNVADRLQDSFEEAVKRKSLGPILRGCAAIESIFKFGETESERQNRENQRRKRLEDAERKAGDQIIALQARVTRLQRLDRPLVEIDEVERQIRNEEFKLKSLKEQERLQEEQEKERRDSLASSLKAECRRDFGRDSPFEGFVGIKEIDSIPRYRNPYAHMTIAEIYEEHGLESALNAVEITLRLVTDLKVKRIAPETTILIGLGQDCYGRELIYFVREGDITEDGHIALDWIQAMYKEHSFYTPFAICLMLARKDEGNICNPIIYYKEDVMM